jgi:hypothetical protein
MDGWHDLGWPIVTITVRKNDGDNSPHFRTRMRLHVSVLSSNKGYITKKNVTIRVLGRNYIWLTKFLEVLMQRIAFCSLAVPTLAGWVTLLPLRSRDHGSGLRRRLCLAIVSGTLGTLGTICIYLNIFMNLVQNLTHPRWQTPCLKPRSVLQKAKAFFQKRTCSGHDLLVGRGVRYSSSSTNLIQ